jgi:sec-independent protein translocase protein TatB
MDFMGWQELMLIAVVTLIVIGPERLPETLRTLGLWMGRLRRSFVSVKTEIEKEIGMDDIRRQLHNEAVMDEMRKIEEEVKSSVEPAISATEPPPIYSDDTAPRPAATDAVPSEDSTAPEATAANTPEKMPELEPEPPLPRSEAELEALHEARRKQDARQKKSQEADSGR